jgi:hypothetical protein
MKKLVVAVVLSTLISSAGYSTNWGMNDTENKNIEGVVLVDYIHGNYPRAGTLFEKLNPFKSKWRTFRALKNSLEDKYGTDGESISSGANYEAFKAGEADKIAFGDTDLDGNLNQAELDVLEALGREVEESKGSNFGCDAVTALSDKINQAIPIGLVSVGSLIPFSDKCNGL